MQFSFCFNRFRRFTRQSADEIDQLGNRAYRVRAALFQPPSLIGQVVREVKAEAFFNLEHEKNRRMRRLFQRLESAGFRNLANFIKRRCKCQHLLHDPRAMQPVRLSKSLAVLHFFASVLIDRRAPAHIGFQNPLVSWHRVVVSWRHGALYKRAVAPKMAPTRDTEMAPR